MFSPVDFDTRLRAPFGLLNIGCTLSGKSEWTFKLIRERHKIIDKPPSRVVYAYSEWQPGFEQLKRDVPEVEFIHGLNEILDSDDFFSPQKPALLVIDDLALEVASDARSKKIFTQYLHHKNLCVVFVLQNLFAQGKSIRDIHLNAQYIILFKAVRDVHQISVLARQMGLPHIIPAYKECTSQPYCPLLLDLKPDTPAYLRVRSHFMPGQNTHLYLEKNSSSLPKNVETR